MSREAVLSSFVEHAIVEQLLRIRFAARSQRAVWSKILVDDSYQSVLGIEIT
jgi:hypothetical protein